MHHPTISIDFGASFTKVGFRGRCELFGTPSRYEETATLLGLDETVLIPTLAVRTQDEKRPWLFGAAAADLTPGPKMKVFQNWKAGLFRRDNSADAAEASIIAQHYFEWLRMRIVAISGMALSDCVVRVMVPAFNDFADLTGVLRKCFDLAGWQPRDLQFWTEPHANALGLLTGGRNVYTKGRDFEGIDYLATYGANNPYIRSARNQLLPGRNRELLRIAIVDIGAFTTDVAILTFDPLREGRSDGLTEIAQLSLAVGTHESLDRKLWRELEARYGIDFYKFSFRQRELIKFALFAGETFSLANGVILGAGEDFSIVTAIANAMARDVWKEVGREMPIKGLKEVFLSGGGAQIQLLVEALERQGMRITTPPQTAVVDATIPKKGSLVPLRDCGEPLERVATALGGCSLVAKEAAAESPKIGRQPSKIMSVATDTSPKSCSCGGLNIDCARCGGTGYFS